MKIGTLVFGFLVAIIAIIAGAYFLSPNRNLSIGVSQSASNFAQGLGSAVGNECSSAGLNGTQCSCMRRNMTEGDFELFMRVMAVQQRTDISEQVKQSQMMSIYSENGSDIGRQMALMAAMQTASQECGLIRQRSSSRGESPTSRQPEALALELADNARGARQRAEHSSTGSAPSPAQAPPAAPSASDLREAKNRADAAACEVQPGARWSQESGCMVPTATWARRPTGRDFARHYPAEALEAGQSGYANLNCVVGERGQLESCIVLRENPAGQGYGAAALEMTQYYTRDLSSDTPGSSVAFRVAFRVAN